MVRRSTTLRAGTTLAKLLLLDEVRLMMLVGSHLSRSNVATTIVAAVGLLRALEGTRLLFLAEGDAAADQATDDTEDDGDNAPDGHLLKLLLDFAADVVGVFVRLDVSISAKRIRIIISGATGESGSPGTPSIMFSLIKVGVVVACERTLDLVAPLSVLGVNEASAVGNLVVITASLR